MSDHSLDALEMARMALAQRIARDYSALPQVEAVVLAGSQAAGNAGPDSDLDFYVYVHRELPISERRRIAEARARYAEVDNQFWEPGDEWVDLETQIHIDVMFRSRTWIEAQIKRVLQQHEASVGYSTCFWQNVLSSMILFDRAGWFRDLQQRTQQPYPELLRRAIIAKNFPLLRQQQSAYLHQIERALARRDLVSVNHRVAALLASYFDILFALNRVPHPGEKRLLQLAAELCRWVPEAMAAHVTQVLQDSADADPMLISSLQALISNLEAVLRTQNLLAIAKSLGSDTLPT